jgi:hypothetical protein
MPFKVVTPEANIAALPAYCATHAAYGTAFAFATAVGGSCMSANSSYMVAIASLLAVTVVYFFVIPSCITVAFADMAATARYIAVNCSCMGVTCPYIRKITFHVYFRMMQLLPVISQLFIYQSQLLIR